MMMTRTTPVPTPEIWFTEKEFAFQNVGFAVRIRRQVHSEETPWQRLDVFETFHFGKMLVLDGIIQLTECDEFFYHEQIVHVPLFMHPAPKRVLIVGGGDGGSAREVLRHPTIETVDLAEIDEKVILASRQWFPQVACSFEDERVHVHITDAIRYVADAPDNNWDAIIIDSSDPIGPAVGRFQQEFYANCHRTLNDPGVLVAQTGSFWYEPEESRAACLLMREIFGRDRATIYYGPTPTYPSGTLSYTVAGKGLDPLDFATVRKPEGEAFAPLQHYTATNHSAHFALPRFIANGLAQS